MMRRSREIAVRWGIIAAVFILTIVFVLSYRSARELVDSDRWVSHTFEVLASLRETYSDLVEAENSRRGYSLYRDSRAMEDFQHYTAVLPKELAKLRELTQDNPRQQARLNRLDGLTARRIALLQQALDLKASTPAATDNAQQALYRQAQTVMSDCRNTLNEMVFGVLRV